MSVLNRKKQVYGMAENTKRYLFLGVLASFVFIAFILSMWMGAVLQGNPMVWAPQVGSLCLGIAMTFWGIVEKDNAKKLVIGHYQMLVGDVGGKSRSIRRTKRSNR